jgi:dolichyl-phosphate-mannose--protein O-mannosyl transferase
MFGNGAAFIALALLTFDANLLAHGAVVGTDMGLSCFMFAAIYAFYRYVKAPSTWRMAVTGLATGLALASKHTAILVIPMMIFLAIGEIVSRPDDSPGALSRGKRTRQLATALVVVSIIALAVLWGFYGFRYQARPGNLQLNPPFAENVQQLSRPHEVRLLGVVANWHLLPESYLYGLADVRIMSDAYTS